LGLANLSSALMDLCGVGLGVAGEPRTRITSTFVRAGLELVQQISALLVWRCIRRNLPVALPEMVGGKCWSALAVVRRHRVR